MEAKVIRWGDDLAVRLTAEEVERLGLSEGQTVEIVPKPRTSAQVDGGAVGTVSGLRYVNGTPAYTIEDMVAEMRRLGPENEPETIDWGPDRGSEIIDDDDPR